MPRRICGGQKLPDLRGPTGPGQQPLDLYCFFRGCPGHAFCRCASLDHQVLESSTEKASPDSGAVGSAVVSRRHIRTTGSTRKVSTRAVCRCRASTASWAAATASSARPSLERTTPRLSRADARLCPWMSGLMRASRRLRSTASWAATCLFIPACSAKDGSEPVEDARTRGGVGGGEAMAGDACCHGRDASVQVDVPSVGQAILNGL